MIKNAKNDKKWMHMYPFFITLYNKIFTFKMPKICMQPFILLFDATNNNHSLLNILFI
jgi:hypothetical protein